jgi:hypothetical protein
VINPWEVLAIHETTKWNNVRVIFRNLVRGERRDQRAIATLAYEMMRVTAGHNPLPAYLTRVSPTLFSYDEKDPVVMTYIGECTALSSAIDANPSIMRTRAEKSCPLVYLAARSGHVDVIQMLLRHGADVNARGNGSSALHAAAFFGHSCVVQELIAFGASITFRNRFDNPPADEAATQKIKDLIRKANEDPLALLLRELKSLPVSGNVETIAHHGKTIGYRVLRKLEDRAKITKTWKVGWHGTTRAAVVSIFKTGLKSAGTVVDETRISERKGHCQRGYTVAGNPNWSRAVFASPVLRYAAHRCYAETVRSTQRTGEWCILVHAYIRPGTYTTHHSTIVGKYAGENEVEEHEEIRAELGGDEKVLNHGQSSAEVIRVHENANVVVAAVLLAPDEFIRDLQLSHKELSELMQGSDAWPGA